MGNWSARTLPVGGGGHLPSSFSLQHHQHVATHGLEFSAGCAKPAAAVPAPAGLPGKQARFYCRPSIFDLLVRTLEMPLTGQF
jgi:hypothetical protein